MAKIYYTLGPASLERSVEMYTAGADGVRLTFSFGTPEIQLERARMVHLAAKEAGSEAIIVADLTGGGARIGEVQNEKGEESFLIEKDEEVVIECRATVVIGATKILPVPDSHIYNNLSVGTVLVLGDGGVEFEVVSDGEVIRAKSLFTGLVEGRRGLTVQTSSFDPGCLTEKDKADLVHIAEHAEYTKIALSFVSSKSDVEEAREILDAAGSTQKVIAKIETKNGVYNIEEICEVADEVMVARGDLALALPWEEMPAAVDTIVAACKASGTPFIMATQVAEGMLHGNSMTRAEMTDLWHWKKEGMSGVLLSRETAWGDRPVETIENVHKLLSIK